MSPEPYLFGQHWLDVYCDCSETISYAASTIFAPQSLHCGHPPCCPLCLLFNP